LGKGRRRHEGFNGGAKPGSSGVWVAEFLAAAEREEAPRTTVVMKN
jgi:hypothetical protein